MKPKADRRPQKSRLRGLSKWPIIIGVLVVGLGLFANEVQRPGLLLVGNITIDVVEGKQKAVGGAVPYAAVVARAYGVRACVVTAAGPDANLSIFDGHELHVVDAGETLTFEHTYTWWGNKRKLRVTAQPNVTLTIANVPPHCRRARIALLGPLTQQDLDAASFVSHQQGWWDSLTGFRQQVGLMAQGQQRHLDPSGRVQALQKPSPDLLAALGPRTSVFLSDVETDVWPQGTVEELSLRSARWLVTRGELGADEVVRRTLTQLPPEKVTAVDTNGAGDTFATAYMLALAARSLSPGATANWAASRAVTQPQSCKPGCIEAAIKRDSYAARFGTWMRMQSEWLQAQYRGVQHYLPALQLHVRCPDALASAAGHLQWAWQYLCRRLGVLQSSAPAI